MGETVVVALGGNAILQRGQRGTIEEQLENVRLTSGCIADLVERGYRVVITHGNGPQVGNILIQQSVAKAEVPAMPLDVCGAESQGLIGYMIQLCLRNELNQRGIEKPVTVLVSQTLVRGDDPAFKNPAKPVGPFFSEAEARRAMKETGEKWIEDSGRGWRKVVPSPEPVEVLEAPVVHSLLNSGSVVIAAGGGGIPVVKTGGKLKGIEAVIDKDLAAARLALQLDADHLLILTDVRKVAVNYRKPDERLLDVVTVGEAEALISKGEFGRGSMEPKVRAAIMMAKHRKKATIASLYEANKALRGEAGTQIVE